MLTIVSHQGATMNKYFSSRLKELREYHGLSQAELADKLSISRGSISFYENNSRVPDIDVLFSLCKYFSVTSDYLLGLSDDPEEKPTATKDLGLSYAAVDRLLAWNTRYPDGKTGLSALSQLIVHSEFFHLLLQAQELFLFAGSEATFTSSSRYPPDDLRKKANEKGWQLISNGAFSNIIVSYLKDDFGKILSEIVSYENQNAVKRFCPDNGKYLVTSAEDMQKFMEYRKKLEQTLDQGGGKSNNQDPTSPEKAETDK